MRDLPDYIRSRREKLEAGDVERSIVVPVNVSLPVRQRVLTDQQVRDVLASTDLVAVTECSCRATPGGCDSPRDVCIVMGSTARSFADDPFYRAITVDEAMSILDRTAEAGLVHLTLWERGHVPEAVCSCCPCCCHELRALREFGFHDHVVASDFVARLDAEACNGCGACEGRCAFGALGMAEGRAAHSPERCFGCGLCAMVCPTGALAMEERR